MQNTNTIKTKIKDLLFYLILLLLWQLIYWICVEQLEVWKSYSFPNPINVIKSIIYMIKEGSLFLAVIYSLKRAFFGFFLALFVGIIIGSSITLVKYLQRNLKPLLMGIQTLPSICWVPFAILWFGLKESAIIFVVFMGTVFSISLAVEDSIRRVPIIYIKAAKTMGASRLNLYTKVILPAALPSFVAALKQSWSFAWRALMSGEILSSCVGLGYTLMMGRNLADINQVMAVMVVIIMVGILIDKFVFSIMLKKMLMKRGLN